MRSREVGEGERTCVQDMVLACVLNLEGRVRGLFMQVGDSVYAWERERKDMGVDVLAGLVAMQVETWFSVWERCRRS